MCVGEGVTLLAFFFLLGHFGTPVLLATSGWRKDKKRRLSSYTDGERSKGVLAPGRVDADVGFYLDYLKIGLGLCSAVVSFPTNYSPLFYLPRNPIRPCVASCCPFLLVWSPAPLGCRSSSSS